MRIAIDATSVPPKPAGAGVYAIELVRAMTRRGRHDGYALYTRGRWLDADIEGKRNWRIEHIRAGSRPARLAWEQLRLPRALAALDIDVLHSTHHTLPLAGVSCRRVVTIHDVTFFRIPERYPPVRRFYMQAMTRLGARVADAIIVPSDAVRDDVVRTLRVPPMKVTTVYEAAASQFVRIDGTLAGTIAREYGIEGPYVLSVGSLEPGKNHARLIHAMRALRTEGFEYRLVIVGQKAWKFEDSFALVDRLGMSDRVAYLGYVKDEHLPALYSGAAAFAFPSLYEGFGLCIVEAMACGVPVLTSHISATAEVAGGAALLVDPLSIDAIRGGLRRLLEDDRLRRDLASRGLARAAQFSWQRAAEETRAVYRRAVHGNSAPA